MYYVSLASIITIALSYRQTCTSTCSYIYDNRTGDYTPTTEDVKELYRDLNVAKFRTGVYTVIGQFQCPVGKNDDYLRFRKLHDDGIRWMYQPLVMRIHDNNNAEFYAQVWDANNMMAVVDGQHFYNWKSGTDMSLQISDHARGRYSIYLNAHFISYNYNNNWYKYYNRRLDTINNIFSDLYCIQYKYIMVCDDLKVDICDVSKPDEKLQLGLPYVMQCGGTGSPLLEITWAVQYEFGENKDVLRSIVSSVASDRDDVVKSKINIRKFLLDDIGKYTCTVTNKNYRNTASYTFTLSYTEPVKLTTSSNPKFYKTSNLPLLFTWNIRGCPLNDIKAECTSNGSNLQELVANKTRIDKYPIPVLIFNWNITSPTTATHIYCHITTNGIEIYSNKITRVGHSCVSGSYGENDDCIPCPTGMVSPPQAYEHDQCVYKDTFCLSGMYGVGNECSKCPAGMTSEDFAVKIQECFDGSGVSLRVIIAGCVGAFVFIIGIIIGIVCFCRLRRGEGIKKKREVAIDISLNINSKGSNPLAKENSESLYVNRTISDLDSVIYEVPLNDYRENTTPNTVIHEEPLYHSVQDTPPRPARYVGPRSVNAKNTTPDPELYAQPSAPIYTDELIINPNFSILRSRQKLNMR